MRTLSHVRTLPFEPPLNLDPHAFEPAIRTLAPTSGWKILALTFVDVNERSCRSATTLDLARTSP